VEQERKRLHLHESESVVLQCASRIFSAYIASGQVHERNEDHMMEKAIHLAEKMAHRTDERIMDDAELPKQNSRLPF
jgi:hypothetical protein